MSDFYFVLLGPPAFLQAYQVTAVSALIDPTARNEILFWMGLSDRVDTRMDVRDPSRMVGVSGTRDEDDEKLSIS